MSNLLPTYSSANVNVAWCGISFKGLAADTFFSATRNADQTEADVGADSFVGLSILPDKTATIEISLQQSSPSNNALAAVLAVQDNSGAITIGDLTLFDPSAGSLMHLSDAHIQKGPTLDFGDRATGKTRVWTFHAAKATYLEIPEGFAADNPQLANILSAAGTAKDFMSLTGLTDAAGGVVDKLKSLIL